MDTVIPVQTTMSLLDSLAHQAACAEPSPIDLSQHLQDVCQNQGLAITPQTADRAVADHLARHAGSPFPVTPCGSPTRPANPSEWAQARQAAQATYDAHVAVFRGVLKKKHDLDFRWLLISVGVFLFSVIFPPLTNFSFGGLAGSTAWVFTVLTGGAIALSERSRRQSQKKTALEEVIAQSEAAFHQLLPMEPDLQQLKAWGQHPELRLALYRLQLTGVPILRQDQETFQAWIQADAQAHQKTREEERWTQWQDQVAQVASPENLAIA